MMAFVFVAVRHDIRNHLVPYEYARHAARSSTTRKRMLGNGYVRSAMSVDPTGLSHSNSEALDLAFIRNSWRRTWVEFPLPPTASHERLFAQTTIADSEEPQVSQRVLLHVRDRCSQTYNWRTG